MSDQNHTGDENHDSFVSGEPYTGRFDMVPVGEAQQEPHKHRYDTEDSRFRQTTFDEHGKLLSELDEEEAKRRDEALRNGFGGAANIPPASNPDDNGYRKFTFNPPKGERILCADGKYIEDHGGHFKVQGKMSQAQAAKIKELAGPGTARNWCTFFALNESGTKMHFHAAGMLQSVGVHVHTNHEDPGNLQKLHQNALAVWAQNEWHAFNQSETVRQAEDIIRKAREGSGDTGKKNTPEAESEIPEPAI